jgi:hypothetical protein
MFQDPSCVFYIGCSQVFLPKHYHNCPAKPVYAVDGYGLGHVEVVVMRVSRNCICKHLESNYAFLDCGETKRANNVSLQFEVVTKLSQFLNDLQEKLPSNSETTPKCDVVVQRVVGEIVGVSMH